MWAAASTEGCTSGVLSFAGAARTARLDLGLQVLGLAEAVADAEAEVEEGCEVGDASRFFDAGVAEGSAAELEALTEAEGELVFLSVVEPEDDAESVGAALADGVDAALGVDDALDAFAGTDAEEEAEALADVFCAARDAPLAEAVEEADSVLEDVFVAEGVDSVLESVLEAEGVEPVLEAVFVSEGVDSVFEDVFVSEGVDSVLEDVFVSEDVGAAFADVFSAGEVAETLVEVFSAEEEEALDEALAEVEEGEATGGLGWLAASVFPELVIEDLIALS